MASILRGARVPSLTTRVCRPTAPRSISRRRSRRCAAGRTTHVPRRGGRVVEGDADPPAARPRCASRARRRDDRGGGLGRGRGGALEAAPALCGVLDDPPCSRRTGPSASCTAATRACGSAATGAVFEALVPYVLEQRVSGLEAYRSWRQLVRGMSERAPGPLELWLPPAPERLASEPYTAFHDFEIEAGSREHDPAGGRSRRGLERFATRTPAEATRALISLPGIGAWTAAMVTGVALGDAGRRAGRRLRHARDGRPRARQRARRRTTRACSSCSSRTRRSACARCACWRSAGARAPRATRAGAIAARRVGGGAKGDLGVGLDPGELPLRRRPPRRAPCEPGARASLVAGPPRAGPAR